MVTSNRVSINIEITYVILRGLFDKGISLFGPFNTIEEAIEYGGKNFSDDTREIIKMTKEIVTHKDLK